MKLHIEQGPGHEEVEIIVRCGVIDDRLEWLLHQIRLYGFSLRGTLDGRDYNLPPETVVYFESVEDQTYAYCQKDVYRCSYRLYELEKQLDKTAFLRISKSVILNMNYIESVRSLLDGRIEVLLKTREKAMVNRHYVPEFKKYFGLKGEI